MYQITANIMWFSLVPSERENGAPDFAHVFNLRKMWVVRVIL